MPNGRRLGQKLQFQWRRRRLKSKSRVCSEIKPKEGEGQKTRSVPKLKPPSKVDEKAKAPVVAPPLGSELPEVSVKAPKAIEAEAGAKIIHPFEGENDNSGGDDDDGTTTEPDFPEINVKTSAISLRSVAETGAIAVGSAVLGDKLKSDQQPDLFSITYSEDGEITEAGVQQIDKIIGGIHAISPKARITLEGHSNAEGSDELNRDLSRARAEDVAGRLAKAGIDPELIEVSGLGKDRFPSNSTAKNISWVDVIVGPATQL